MEVPLGGIALAVAVLAWSLDAMLEKKAGQHLSAIEMGLVYGLFELVALPFYWLAFRSQIRLEAFSAPGVAWSVAAAAVGLVAFLANFVALQHLEASVVAGYGLGYLAVSAVLCVAFLGEPMTPWKAAGLALMAAGAWALGR